MRIESISEASSAPFESRFAPSTVSTFTTNFVIVTVDKCYVKIAHITLKLKVQNLSIRPLRIRYIEEIATRRVCANPGGATDQI